jgi:hypothetical protein
MLASVVAAIMMVAIGGCASETRWNETIKEEESKDSRGM